MPRWTDEARRKQADQIRRTQPWTKTTGPRTPAGKAASRRNAQKSGRHSAETKALRAWLRWQSQCQRAMALWLRAQKFSSLAAESGREPFPALIERARRHVDRLLASEPCSPIIERAKSSVIAKETKKRESKPENEMNSRT